MTTTLVLLPLLLTALLNVLPRRISKGFAPCAFMAFCALQMYFAGKILIEPSLAPFGLFGIALNQSADALSAIVLFSAGLVSLCSMFTAWGMIKDDRALHNFVSLSLIALLGMNAIATATDIFTVYVFIEVTAIGSFILIALPRGRKELEGAFKYIILSAIASALMLSAIAVMLMFSGSTSFEGIARFAETIGGTKAVMLGAGLFLCGALIKSGVMPFHGWLPDAYSASPTPVSILLAGIITKASGVYVLLRLAITVFPLITELSQAMMILGAASIVIAAFAAITQRDMKRLLAYSSISQVGYIILAAGCATPLAIAGAAFHFFNHAVFKSLLFVSAASVENATDTLDMEQLGGLSQKMPLTGTASAIGFLSAAGIPPLAGFFSKLIIIVALWQAGRTGYAFIAVLASVVTLGYFLMLQRQAFFGKIAHQMESVRESGLFFAVPQIILSAISVAGGFFLPLVLRSFNASAPIINMLAK